MVLEAVPSSPLRDGFAIVLVVGYIRVVGPEAVFALRPEQRRLRRPLHRGRRRLVLVVRSSSGDECHGALALVAGGRRRTSRGRAGGVGGSPGRGRARGALPAQLLVARGQGGGAAFAAESGGASIRRGGRGWVQELRSCLRRHGGALSGGIVGDIGMGGGGQRRGSSRGRDRARSVAGLCRTALSSQKGGHRGWVRSQRATISPANQKTVRSSAPRANPSKGDLGCEDGLLSDEVRRGMAEVGSRCGRG